MSAAGAAARRAKGLVARAADRVYGIESETQVAATDLGYEEHGDNLHYQASSWLSVPGMFSGWTPPPGAGDVIADLGCGKGRAMVQLARRFPVDRIVGVELSPRLAEVARRNLGRTAGKHRAKAWEVVVADARRFEVPDDVTIAYVANPFAGQVFAEAMQRLLESHDRRPRRLQLAYVAPVEVAQLEATGRFREIPVPERRWMRPVGVDPAEFRRFEVLPAR